MTDSWPAIVETAATSQQQTSEPTAEWRALVKRSADFCRRDPAGWARSVGYSDSLIARGVDRDEAIRQALDLYDR